MAKSCKEITFFKKKKTHVPSPKTKAKEEKAENYPMESPNTLKNPQENHEMNLEKKFKEENFDEKDFENSFQSIPNVYSFYFVDFLYIQLVKKHYSIQFQ